MLSRAVVFPQPARSGRNKGQQVTLYYKGANCDLIAWLKDVAVKRGEHLIKLEKAGTFWEGFPLNNLTKEGGVLFPQGKKPEALIKKILELATEPGDWVLDSFAGSGTTAAVAHKMGRKWIAIELEEHCHTHIIPRLTRVIDGQDSGGITKVAKWKGGGGFRYFRLVACRRVTITRLLASKLSWPLAAKSCSPTAVRSK